MADNLTTFMCRVSRNYGASTSGNSKGPSRPVAGKLYLLYITVRTLGQKMNKELKQSKNFCVHATKAYGGLEV
jgi:hypothetical protein